MINIDSSQFINNLAEGDTPFQTTQGGAISMNATNAFNFTVPVTETITNSVFAGNQACRASRQWAERSGGAIASSEGTLALSGTTFTGNQAIAGSSSTSFGGITSGGALITTTEVLLATSDTFLNNKAVGGSSPIGVTFATGGAINVFLGNPGAPNPISSIADSLFAGNEVVAGVAGGGSFALTGGGAIANTASPVNVSNTSFLGNQALGSQASSGVAGTEADGGAIWAQGSTMNIQGGLIAGNIASGGAGGDAPGGVGGAGGNGSGGGVASIFGSSLTISGTTIAGNRAIGGAGGHGSTRGAGGNGVGGGIEVDGLLHACPRRAASSLATWPRARLEVATAMAAAFTPWGPRHSPTRS